MQVITMDMIGDTGLDCKTYFMTDKYAEWGSLSAELKNMVMGALSNELNYVDYRRSLYGK